MIQTFKALLQLLNISDHIDEDLLHKVGQKDYDAKN